MTGQALFSQDQRATASTELSAIRKEKGISGKQHAGMLQSTLKDQWHALSDTERDEWNSQAEALMVNIDHDALVQR
jgi:hypothetical protein